MPNRKVLVFLIIAAIIWTVAIYFVHHNHIRGASATMAWGFAGIFCFGILALMQGKTN